MLQRTVFSPAAAVAVGTQVSGSPAGSRQHLQGPPCLSPETRLAFWPVERSSHQSCCCREWCHKRTFKPFSDSISSSVHARMLSTLQMCTNPARMATLFEPKWQPNVPLIVLELSMIFQICQVPSSLFFSRFASWMRNSWALSTGHVIFSWLYGSHLTLSPANRHTKHTHLWTTLKNRSAFIPLQDRIWFFEGFV